MRALSSGVEETRRIEVDRALRASETQVLESVESGHSSHEVAARVSKDLGIDLPPIRVDGQCKYGLLSQGQVKLKKNNKQYSTYFFTFFSKRREAVV